MTVFGFKSLVLINELLVKTQDLSPKTVLKILKE
jgi:hypothetical protein